MINTDNITVFTHTSIRVVCGEKVVYSDPFQMREAPHDADIVLFTHSHYDHFSPEDVEKVAKEGTVFVAPESMKGEAMKGIPGGKGLMTVSPGAKLDVMGISVEAVAAYNVSKAFHPKKNGWVGYVIEYEGVRTYIAGDTDINEDNKKVRCDIALVPSGGTYTMNAREAAELVNIIKPEIAIPTHYGSIVGKDSDAREFSELVDKGIRVEIKKQW